MTLGDIGILIHEIKGVLEEVRSYRHETPVSFMLVCCTRTAEEIIQSRCTRSSFEYALAFALLCSRKFGIRVQLLETLDEKLSNEREPNFDSKGHVYCTVFITPTQRIIVDPVSRILDANLLADKRIPILSHLYNWPPINLHQLTPNNRPF